MSDGLVRTDAEVILTFKDDLARFLDVVDAELTRMQARLQRERDTWNDDVAEEWSTRDLRMKGQVNRALEGLEKQVETLSKRGARIREYRRAGNWRYS